MDPYSNVKAVIKDGKLHIEIDLESVTPKPSSSGKSMVFATTGGAQQVEGYALNLTLYKR